MVYALALAGLQFLSSSYTQKENQRRQQRANARFERLTKRFAGEDFVNNWAAVTAQQIQQSELIKASLDEVSKDAARRIGAVKASAGAAGVKGHSVEAVVRDFHANQLLTEQNLAEQERRLNDQTALERQGLLSKYRERVLMSKQPDVPGPSYLQNFLDSTAMYLNLQRSMGYDWKSPFSTDPAAPDNVPQHK